MSIFPAKLLKNADDGNQRIKIPAGYRYQHIVSIGDTDITRNVYFTKYLEWLGYAREAMFLSKVSPDKILSGKIVMVTKNTAIAYLQEYQLYDTANLFVTMSKVSRTSAKLFFRYFNQELDRLCAVAKQLIITTDLNGKPTVIPPEFLELTAHYHEENEIELNAHLLKRMF
ncbi:MAG: thioesterase family protein [Desulfobulbaceae bacterium]|nr:thioesterase family protein [Desulfobulbaceae bacterium]HIJ79481.1 hypothetical protein [Deltaproteobacteria bacterium]